MRLTYIGPSIDGVDVPLQFGGDIHCDHHKTAEFPEELAARLLEQESNWRLAPSEVAKVTKAEKAAEQKAEEAEALREAARALADGDSSPADAEHQAEVAGEERRRESKRAEGRKTQGADGDKPADSDHGVAHQNDDDGGQPAEED